MIKSTFIAYKIGFSSSLNPNTLSGYAELAKWSFEEKNKRRLMTAFIGGYAEGRKLLRLMPVEVFVSRQKPMYAAPVAMAPFNEE